STGEGVVVRGVDDAEVRRLRTRAQVDVPALPAAHEAERVLRGVVFEIVARRLLDGAVAPAARAGSVDQIELRGPLSVRVSCRILRHGVRRGRYFAPRIRAFLRRSDGSGARGPWATGDGLRDSCGSGRAA